MNHKFIPFLAVAFMVVGLMTVTLAAAHCHSAKAYTVNGETTFSQIYDWSSTELDGGIYQISLSLCTEGVTPFKDDKGQWTFKGDGKTAIVTLYSTSKALAEGVYTPNEVNFDENNLKPLGYKVNTFAIGKETKLFGLFPIPIFSYCTPISGGKQQAATYFTTGNVTVKKAGEAYDILLLQGEESYHFHGVIDPKKTVAATSHYYDKTKKEKPIETKYAALGSEKTAYVEIASADTAIKKFEIWYPKALETSSKRYPVVIYANGTWTPASTQPDFFDHLASWGFIVVCNEDPSTRTGASSQASLEKILALNNDAKSLFHNKVDGQNIGMAGHSQGGVAAYNAVAAQPGGKCYKALYAASATSPYWGQEGVFGHEWSYDLRKVHIPTFMIAGTGFFDSGTAKDIHPKEGQGICPLWSLETNYNTLPAKVKKIYARKKNIDHGETLNEFDGYMTAWFRWLLCGDTEAAKAFAGKDGEIKGNSLYQDVKANF